MSVRAETQIDLARVDDGSPGTNGATFTPSVDSAGNISWTNDGGLPNPQTQNIMGPSSQYFWYESSGADAGAHITEVPQDEWSDVSDPNYHSGGNMIAQSTKIAIRDGMTELASFGTSGVVIGQNASGISRTEIGTGGMQIIQNVSGTDTQIANLGYGKTSNSVNATVDSPYFTIGTRVNTAPVYDPTATYLSGDLCTYNGDIYSCINGISTPESWDSSHWRYYIGEYSAAIGRQITASGSCSVAVGLRSIARNSYAFAAGVDAVASGNASIALGRNVHANGSSQTVIGEYNIPNVGYSFIIGNGYNDSTRSNALTVDWTGDVFLGLDTTAASGTDHDLYVTITALGWEPNIIV